MKFCPRCRCWFSDDEFVAGDVCCSVCRNVPEALHSQPDPAEVVFPYEAVCVVCEEAYIEDGNNYDSLEEDFCDCCREKIIAYPIVSPQFPWRQWSDDTNDILAREGLLLRSPPMTDADHLAVSEEYKLAFPHGPRWKGQPDAQAGNIGLGDNFRATPPILSGEKDEAPT